MRADDREKLLKELEIKDDAEPTRSMYFRVGKSAYKTIAQLAELSGAKKSDVVRKLVTRALTGKDIEIGGESQSVKLNWLVRESKRNGHDADVIKKGIADIRERLESKETAARKISDNSEKLLTEIYCMVVAISLVQKYSLVKLIESSPMNVTERDHSREIASLALTKSIALSLNDLDRLATFYDLKIGPRAGHKTYVGTKIEVTHNAVDERPKKTDEEECDSRL